MSNKGSRSVDAFGEWILPRSLAEDRTSVDPRTPEIDRLGPSSQVCKAVLPTAQCDQAQLPSPSPTDLGLPHRIPNNHEDPSRDIPSSARQNVVISPRVKRQLDAIVGAPAVLQSSSCGSVALGEDHSGPPGTQDEVTHLGSPIQPSTAGLVPSKRKKLKTSCVDHGSRSSPCNRSEPKENVSLLDTHPTATTVKQSRMLQNLYPHNDGPPIGIHPSIGLQISCRGSDGDSRRLRVTRTEARNHQRRTRNEPETPQKSLNVRRMMREQLQWSSRESKVSVGSPATSKAQSPRSRSQSCTFQPVFMDRDVPISTQVEDHYYSLGWKSWEDSKETVDKYLGLPMVPRRGSQIRRSIKFRGPQSLRDCNYVIDGDGIYVFKPTPRQYSCFAELLSLMEGTAGRAQGAVKVVVPEQCTSPYKDDYSQPNILGDVKVPVYSTTLSQCPSSKKAGLYLVCTKEVDLGKAPVVKILEKIQEETANWLKKLGGANFEVDNVWRRREETQFTGQDMRFTEKDMMDCVLEAASTLPWCVLDEPATPKLRKALECDDLHLGDDSSNGFLKSPTVKAGLGGPSLDQPSFNCSTRSGTIFPMQLGDFAAHTLIYHHAGGPRTYAIVKPSNHRRLEEFISLAFQRDKTPKPPTCSQFISHESVYIPKATLIANSIEFTEITQFERELLIVFPYAYYQGFNGAANVVEERMYASKEWEVFHREGLYVKCNRECAEGEEEFDLDFAEKPENDAGASDSDHDIRPPASKRRCAEEMQERDCVGSEEAKPELNFAERVEDVAEVSDSDRDIRQPASRCQFTPEEWLPLYWMHLVLRQMQRKLELSLAEKSQEVAEASESDHDIRHPASKRQCVLEG